MFINNNHILPRFSRLTTNRNHPAHQGTTLEDEFQADVSSSLWASALITNKDGKDTLQRLHEAFADAGAELIETCT